MKKFLKSRIFIAIITGILCITGTAYAATKYYASDVSYTPKDTSWEVDNVKDAIDELYNNKGLQYIETIEFSSNTQKSINISKYKSYKNLEISNFVLITKEYGLEPEHSLNSIKGTCYEYASLPTVVSYDKEKGNLIVKAGITGFACTSNGRDIHYTSKIDIYVK